ncbi:sugar isomerase domain-containing protein [Georgenia sp. AZ-5]|uniref:sugar isomerase domain-containing protein n=1 Tax=Georgenia sp. AZ-5 TaxID=3367526 RepID=UPI003754763F
MISAEPLTPAATEYLDRVQQILATAVVEEAGAISAAAALLAERFDADGLLYVFGSGHSHVFAEEAFYRAGGTARVCPVLKPDYMLHVSAQRSTELERESGHAEEILDGYALDPRVDTMLVVSNSGANPLPVEVAQAARSRGLPIIAITSRAYASASRQPGARLHEVADIVVDNHCPPGDALVQLREDLPRVGPASSAVGLALLDAIVVDALARQVARGSTPTVFLSAGMAGAGPHNAALTATFRPRVPHL